MKLVIFSFTRIKQLQVECKSYCQLDNNYIFDFNFKSKFQSLGTSIKLPQKGAQVESNKRNVSPKLFHDFSSYYISFNF